MRLFLFFLVLITTSWQSVMADGEVAPNLFTELQDQVSVNKKMPKKGMRSRITGIDLQIFALNQVALNLFDDAIYTATRDKLIEKNSGQKTWIGHIDGEQQSEVTLTINGDFIHGVISMLEASYEINTLKINNQGNSVLVYQIMQLNNEKQPGHGFAPNVEDLINEHGASLDVSPVASGTSSQISTVTPAVVKAANGKTIIDILIAYTTKSKNNAGGTQGIVAKITNAVTLANQAYQNSQVPVSLNLVGTTEVTYNETGKMATTLTDLMGTTDGKMDDIHVLRKSLGADLVSLIATDKDACGIGYLMPASLTSQAFAPYAFSVAHDDSTYACLTNQALAHELGHNQGNAHNIEDSQGLTPAYNYAYGYRVCQSNGYRDIMSYFCTGANKIISYFSNPNVLTDTGLTTGTPTQNTALSMTNTAGIVASFLPTKGQISLPSAPSNLILSALSSTTVALTWTDNSNNEDGFSLERSLDGVNWLEFAVVKSNVTGFTDGALTPATGYKYRIRAFNAAGYSAYTTPSTITTQAACATNVPRFTLSQPGIYFKPKDILPIYYTLTNNDNSSCPATAFSFVGTVAGQLGTVVVAPGNKATGILNFTVPDNSATLVIPITASAANHTPVQNQISIIIDGQAPTIASFAYKIQGTAITFTWNASDNKSGVSRINLVRNGQIIYSDPRVSGYTDRLSAKGTYTYQLNVYDRAGNVNQKTLTVKI